MKPLGSKTVRRASILLVVAGCFWFGRAWILPAVARLLVVDQPQADFDGIVVLEDGLRADGRYDLAAALYREKRSRRIVLIQVDPDPVVRARACDSAEAKSRRALAARDVPAESVELIEGRARQSWESVRLLRDWLAERPGVRLIVLCDRLQSRYLRCALDEVLGEGLAERVSVRGVPNRHYGECDWWKSREGVKGLMEASLRLVYAWCRGEQQVAAERWNPDDYERALQGKVGENLH